MCLNCPCHRALAQPHLRSCARLPARYRTRLPNLSSGTVLKRNTRAATQRVPGSREHHFASSVLKRRKPQAVGMFALARQSSTVWGLCWCNYVLFWFDPGGLARRGYVESTAVGRQHANAPSRTHHKMTSFRLCVYVGARVSV